MKIKKWNTGFSKIKIYWDSQNLGGQIGPILESVFFVSNHLISKVSVQSVWVQIIWVFLHTLPVVLPSKIGFFSWLVLIIFKANKNIRTQISNNPANVPPIIGPNWDKDTGWFLKTFSKSMWSDWLQSLIPNWFWALK